LYNQKKIFFMKKLELNQMENIKGEGCALSAALFLGATISLVTLTAATGGLLTVVAVGGFVGSSVDFVRSCKSTLSY
jgi:hypothetical protein